MQKSLLFLLILNFSFLVQAQDNYKEAYIITLENDTIHGFANFRSAPLNLSECQFKSILESESVMTYYPSDISGYMFVNEDKFYISQKINIADIEHVVFLEYLVKGESASLFYYEQMGTEMFFIKDIYGDFNLIKKKEDKIINESRILKDVSFRKEIYGILGYNAEMLPILNSTKFTRKSMSNAIQKYNEMTCGSDAEACIVYQSKNREYLKFNYALYAGTRFTRGNIDKSQVNSSSSPIGYEIGAQLILSHPRTSNSFSFIVDISLSQLKYELHQVNYITNANYKLSAMALDAAIGAKYVYPKGRLRPGAGIGLGRMYLFNQKIKISNSNIKLENNEWLADAYTEFTCNLSLDYILKNKQAVFIQVNYDTELESVLPLIEYSRDKYSIRGRIGYKF